MPAGADETIGTGETYTTIQAWEDDIEAELTAQYTGRCKGEAFGAVNLNGHTTTADFYYALEGLSTARHDGRAHEVSGAGGARIEWAAASEGIVVSDEFVRVCWMEVRGPGANTNSSIATDSLAASNVLLHHNIVHNNNASAGGFGIRIEDTDVTHHCYRNIVYGSGANNIKVGSATVASTVLHNTTYQNGSADDGINSNVAVTIEANISFDANGSSDISGSGVEDDNATSDATGDGGDGLTNLTASDELINPVVDFSLTDLRVKAGATVVGKATQTYSTGTYPEINVDIEGRTVTGDFDVGASQHISGGTAGSRAGAMGIGTSPTIT